MCRYCEFDKNNHVDKLLYESDDINAYIDGNIMCIDLDICVGDIPLSGDYDTKINYCPMCGRKLGD